MSDQIQRPDALLTKSMLNSIVEFFDDQRSMGTVEFYGMLGAKLSKIVAKDPAWGWRYVQGVHAGTIDPSRLMASAVQALGAALDEVPAVMAYTIEVRVFARPGQIQPGSVILGESKACARPGCRVRFVPNVPWRKYCSSECCVEAHR